MIVITEHWKDICGFEEEYQISSSGRVKSKATGLIRKTNINNSGYSCVTLKCSGKKTKTLTIHRLVATHFIPNPLKLEDVNHKDENKQNNSVDNLEWLGHKSNCNYGSRNEKLSAVNKALNRTGLANPKSKPVFCVDLNKVFESGCLAAKELGLESTKISACCRQKRKTTGGHSFMYYNDGFAVNES